MNCHNCGVEIAAGDATCQRCGVTLAPVCAACQHPSAPGDRFCGNCGARLEADAPAPAQPGPAGEVGPTDSGSPTAPPPPSPPSEPADAPPRVVVCARCQRPNDAAAAFCIDCGFPLLARGERAFHRRLPPLGAFELGYPGGFGFRSIAFIIDWLLVNVPVILLWLSLGQPVPENLSQVFEPQPGWERLQMGLTILTIAYHTALVTYLARTVGKRAFGLYVVRCDGSRVGFGRALARHALSIFSFQLTMGLLFLVALFREDRRALHDLLCDTVVIRRYRRPQDGSTGPDRR